MANFSKLTDQSRINVKPKKVIIKKVQRAGTMASVLTYFGIPQAMLEEVALLNNIELTAQVPVGKLIKIIGE